MGRWVGVWSGGSLLLGIYGCDGGIHLLLWLQWMPLGDGAARVGQHVGPVFQPGPCGLASHQDLPNGVILANLVIIQDCDNSLDFLWKWGEKIQRTTQILRVGCSQSCSLTGNLCRNLSHAVYPQKQWR